MGVDHEEAESGWDQTSGVIDASKMLVRWMLSETTDANAVIEGIRAAGLVPVRASERRTLAEGARSRIAVIDMQLPGAPGLIMAMLPSVPGIIGVAANVAQEQLALRCGVEEVVRAPLEADTIMLHIKRVTRRLEHQEHAGERADKLTSAARADSVQSLSGIMAHKLYSPLSVASTNLQLLREQLVRVASALGEEWVQLDEIASDISRAMSTMNRLVGEMRGLARAESLPAEPVRLADVVRDALARVANPAQVSLELEIASDERATARAEGLQRVIEALLTRALEQVRAVPEPRVKVRVYSELGEARVSVRDNGPGVAEAMRERIFEPSFDEEPSSETAMALALCRELVARMGGVLTLAPGAAGSCLRVRLVPA